MVKGLIIRQAITGVNLLFALLIAYVIYLVGVQQFGAAEVPRDPTTVLDPNADGDLKIAKAGPRSDYEAIATGKMFGDAGTQAVKDPAPIEAPKTIVPTESPLTLYGTAASYPTDPLATAVIENPNATSATKIATYYVGEDVMDNIKLLEVHRQRVILLNRLKNQKEELVMKQLGAATPPSGKPMLDRGRGGRAGAGGPGAHASIQRQEMLDELNNIDSAELLNQLNPQLVKDDQGNVSGITSASLSSVPLAQKVGLQDNDVIQSVNGVQIDSVEKIGEIAQKFQNANTFRMSIMRDGKPQMLTFKVE